MGHRQLMKAGCLGRWLAPMVAMLAIVGACDGAADDDGKTGKGDTPDETAAHSCAKRSADALKGNQRVFTRDAIRWSCSDVEGVTTVGSDDRGQEYCETFAVVKAPPEVEGGVWPEPVTLGRITSVSADDLGVQRVETTAPGLILSDDQIYYLEDHPSEVLGACVFTSWHLDVPGPVPSCAGDTCADVLGIGVTEDIFRMMQPANANEAASALIADCLGGPAEGGDPDDPDDPRHGDYFRGCLVADALYGTAWRRSDPAVCAAANRMRECGCTLDSGADVATSLVPPQPATIDDGNVTLRGFPLGGWVDAATLPAGCRFVDLGDASQTVVRCDLSAADILNDPTDLKRACVSRYGNDIVVYVPIPAEDLTCTPPDGGAYSDSCGAEPWVVTR